MTISEATGLIVAKAKEAPAQFKDLSKAAAMYWAVNELWTAEFQSWQAIVNSSLGILSSPAQCAWERRTAYAEASSLLVQAW